MKKLIISILLITTVSVAFISCYWLSGASVANVTLDLSALNVKEPGDRYARVYLIANNRIFPLRESTKYVEILLPPLSSPEIRLTLEDIPVGPTYRVWLSTGTEENGGWFFTENWAESNTFELSPGQETTVLFTEEDLYSNPVFQPFLDVMGKNLKGVVVDGFDTITTADEQMMYTGFDVYSTLTPTSLPSGYTVNSIDSGADELNLTNILAWLNTNRGILPTEDLAFKTNFSSSLGAVSVLGSAGREVGGIDSVVWFYRDGGLGGADINSDIAGDPTSWQWVNLDSDLIYDCLTAYPGDGYFASTAGVFRLPRAFLLDPTPSIDEHRKPIAVRGRVFSLGLLDYSGDGDILFLGTDNGVWYAQMNLGVFTENLMLEPGTGGHAIRMIEISDFFPTCKAYLSDTYVFIWNGSDWARYPLCAGLPGKITGMAWFQTGVTTVSTYLVVSGEDGLAYLWIN